MKPRNDISAAILAAFAMAMTSLGAAVVRPEPAASDAAVEISLPSAFGKWRETPIDLIVLPPETPQPNGENVQYKAYRDDLDRVVTLAVVYGRSNGAALRLHRPETCYLAQGFVVDRRSIADISGKHGSIPLVFLDTRGVRRNEAVAYWLKEGDSYTTASVGSALAPLIGGGRDAALVRASTGYVEAPDRELLSGFLIEFEAALDDEARHRLTVNRAGTRS